MARSPISTACHSGRVASPESVPMAAPMKTTSASSGTMARSSSSRIETALCPCGSIRSPRSSSICMMTAVDDSTKPHAPIRATAGVKPRAMPTPVSSRAQAATWAAPRPKISRLRLHNRDGRISRPMMNSSITTPSSATCRMVMGSSKRPRPNGPIRSPAARYPSTEPSPSFGRGAPPPPPRPTGPPRGPAPFPSMRRPLDPLSTRAI